jgi:hypothetical protein
MTGMLPSLLTAQVMLSVSYLLPLGQSGRIKVARAGVLLTVKKTSGDCECEAGVFNHSTRTFGGSDKGRAEDYYRDHDGKSQAHTSKQWHLQHMTKTLIN